MKGIRWSGGIACALAAMTGLASTAYAQPDARVTTKTESFDRDPGWEAHNNRIIPERVPTVKQDFGYRMSSFAGEGAGEMGGRVQRSSVPAFFVDKIEPKTLNDQFSAAGTFALKSIDGGSGGLLFGFLNSEQLQGSGDPSSLTMLMIFEREGGRISLRLHNSLNMTCGNFITPYIPGRYRPTPIRKDGTRYRWTLNYDPEGNHGGGQFQYSIKSINSRQPPDDFEGLTFVVDLPPGFKKAGAVFDRFGLTNARKGGGAVEIYFDDLEYAGKREDFSHPVHWEEFGNHGEFKETLQPGAQDFGFSQASSCAGGKSGEIGGAFWRSEDKFGYYADRIGPLTLADRIEASGKIVLQTGSLDSDMAFGFFNSANKDKSPNKNNFMGVHIGGPTRKGHMFSPNYATAKGEAAIIDGPVLIPGKSSEWVLSYDPSANRGEGAVTATVGEQKVTLSLKRGHKTQGAEFDRFGMFSISPGGNLVRVYLDDLKYTVGSGSAAAK